MAHIICSVCLGIFLVAGASFSQVKASKNPKTLRILSPFPDQWTRGSWLSEVIRDYQFETGIKVVSLSHNSRISGEKGYERRHEFREFMVEAYGKNKIDWDVMYFDFSLAFEINSAIWQQLQKKTPSSEKLCSWLGANVKANAPSGFSREMAKECLKKEFSTLHWQSIFKVLFQNFVEDESFIAMHDPIVKRSREFQWQGLYGLMFELVPRGMFFNRKVAKKLGIEIPIVGMTWEEFKFILEKVQRYNSKNQSSKIQAITAPMAREFGEHLQLSMIEARQMKGPGSKPSGFSAKSHLLKFLHLIHGLSRYDPLLKEELLPGVDRPAMSRYAGSDLGQAERPDWFQKDSLLGLLSGKALFFFGEWRDYDLMRELDSEKAGYISVAEYPSVYKRTTMDLNRKGGFVVMRNSKKKDLAREFLLFVSKSKHQKRWMKYTKTISGVSKAQSFGASKSPFSVFFKQMLAKYKNKRTAKEVWDLFEKTHTCYRKNRLPDAESILTGALAQRHYHTWEMNVLSWFQLLSGARNLRNTEDRILSACKS